jgi:hypothetical protein
MVPEGPRPRARRFIAGSFAVGWEMEGWERLTTDYGPLTTARAEYDGAEVLHESARVYY